MRIPRRSLALLCSLLLGSYTASSQVANQWTGLSAPNYFYTFAIDPVDTGRIYATYADGVYKSIDGGANWTQVPLWVSDDAESIIINPLNRDTIYMGVQAIGTGGVGVYRSTNRGSSWTQVYSNKSVTVVAVEPTRPWVVYAGTVTNSYSGATAGFLTSTNGGTTWVQSNTGLGSLEIRTLAVNPVTTRIIYAGTDNGVYRTTDGGQSWASASNGLPVGAVIRAFAIDPANRATLYAGTAGDGMYKSTDSGGSWFSSNSGIGSLTVNTIAVNPVSPSVVYVGASNGVVYRSRDGGSTWSSINSTGVSFTYNVGTVALNRLDPNIVFALYGSGTTGARIYKRLDPAGPAQSVSSICVSITGNDANAGTPAAPLRNIQTALTRAAGGDTVKIAAGGYSEGIITTSQAILLGGYDNTFADSKRDIYANRTVVLGVSSTMLFDRYGSTVDGLFLNGNSVAQTGLDISTGSTVTHTVLVNISAGFGYGIIINGNATVTNNTLRGITRALTIQSGAGSIVKNNIFFNNTFALTNSAANGIARYNDYFSNGTNYLGQFTTPGTLDLALNPLFRDITAGDFRLAANSPCIDAGDPTDPVGDEPSPGNSRIDMGAYGGTKNAGAPAVTPTTIALSSGNNQSARINTAVTNPMVVIITGTGGVPVGGVSVNFAIASAPAGATGQLLSTSSTTTNSSGQASSTLTTGSKIGTYTVTATSGGLTGSPVTFSATGTAGPAATMQLTSGNNQSGAISAALPNPFVVTVTDAGGNVVQGTSVTFALTSALGGSLSSTNATTNSGGQASTTLTFGGSAGTYTVTATSAGLSGSPVTFSATATGLAPTVNTVAPTNITTTTALLKGTINPNGLSTTVTFQYGTTTGYGSTITATQSPVSGSSATSVSATLNGLLAGTTYHYRVVATNSAGTTNGTDQTFVTYSTSYTAATTVSFPSRGNASSYGATDYRIIGLPGASGASVSSIVSGTQNVDWQVYWDNGASSNFLVPYDGSANFNFTVGRAFWVISKTPVNVNRSVTAATLNANQEAQIPLQSGWNLITSPFTSSIAWSRIQTTNGTTGSLYAFNTSFSSSASFDPYVGYYYFNGSPNPPLSTLRVPYASIFGKVTDVQQNTPGSWKVNLMLKSGDMIDREVWFGVDSEAKQSLDPQDARKPRAIGAISEAYFERPEWDVQYPAFASDIRSNVNGLEQWEFTLNTPGLHPSSLTLSGVSAIPDYFSIYLIDETRAKYVDLRRDSVYEFVPAVSRSRFSVLVGGQHEVTQKLREVVPKEFDLGQNFPNPFNPSTTIPISVPVVSEVELAVYNILGQEVKTLHEGILEAGRYWLQWNGKDEAGNNSSSGIYFYRLVVARGKTISGKMMLVR